MRKLISKPKTFENKHTHEVRFCRDNKQMLFRAKYKDTINLYIEIIGIWDRKKNFNRFSKNVEARFVHTNGLYFQTKKGRVFAPCTQKPFIMDGSWPHGMINNNPVPKYTIALGAPWTHCDFYPGYNPLLFISRDQLPESYEQLFNFRKYKVK